MIVKCEKPISNMNRKHVILRPMLLWLYRSWCSTSNHLPRLDLPKLLTAKVDPINIEDETLTEVYNILERVNPIEPALEPLSPKLSRSLVTRVVQNPPNYQSGFRFFNWAARRRYFRSRELQNLICNLLVQEGLFDSYWKTLQELRDGRVSISSDAFRVLIIGYWMIGDAEKAIEVFEKMREYDCRPNVLAYNSILHIMVQKDMVSLAVAMCNLMLKSGCSPNIASYNILIGGLLKSGESKDALCLYDEMSEKGISPNNVTSSILLSVSCQANKVDTAAQSLFDSMFAKGCQPDEVAYKSFLNDLCKLGSFDEAFKLLRSFQKEGYDLCIKAYSCVIDGLFKARRFQEACQWFIRFLKGSGTPDLVLYTIMIKGFCEAKKLNGALHFKKEMTYRGLVLDTQCYNALIKGLCDLGLLNDASSLKREMIKHDRFPNAYTYSILICALSKHGFVSEAIQNFEEMEKSGCSPSVVTFNSFIRGLCKVGDHETAKDVFYKMGISKAPPLIPLYLKRKTLEKLAERDFEAGLFLKPYQRFARLTDNVVVPDITTYNILIDGMCKRKNMREACNLLRQLQREGLKPDSITCGTLIDGFCREDRVDEAINMLDWMINIGVMPDSSPFKSLMKCYCRKKEVSATFPLWLDYLRNLEEWDDEEVKSLEDLHRKGDLVETINALLEMDIQKKKEFDLNPYTIWLIGLCQAGKIEEAWKIFCILKEYKINVTPPSCVWLIECLCRKGKLEAVLEVFHYTLEKGLILRPRICNVLLTSFMHSPSLNKWVSDLRSRMESIGYDVGPIFMALRGRAWKPT